VLSSYIRAPYTTKHHKKSKRNNRSRRSQGGSANGPRTTLTKKLRYVELKSFDNATSTYAYYSAYRKPDITKAVGAIPQFSAYEMWRLKSIHVSVQLASQPANINNINSINALTSGICWTAPDYGANETVSGETIMQYQNAKRNTLSLNKWKKVVNTPAKINSSLDTAGTWNFMLPNSTWVNTSLFDSSFYSGYQFFFQLPGFQSSQPASMPAFSIQTELIVEFKQPAFQSSPSTFSHRLYDAKLEVVPLASLPDDYATYVFASKKDARDPITGKRDYAVRFIPEDPLSGLPSITYSADDFLTLHRENKSGAFFGNRRIRYTGPAPDIYHQF